MCGVLSTTVALRAKHVDVELKCLVCELGMETLDHVFLWCVVVC